MLLPWISPQTSHTHNGSLWIQYKIATHNSFRNLCQTHEEWRKTIRSYYGSVCQRLYTVQGFPLLLRTAWASLRFQGLLGSKRCWKLKLVCPKSCPWTVKEYAARERLFRLTDCNSWSQASWMEARQDKSWATCKYYTVASWKGDVKVVHPSKGFLVALNLNSWFSCV